MGGEVLAPTKLERRCTLPTGSVAIVDVLQLDPQGVSHLMTCTRMRLKASLACNRLKYLKFGTKQLKHIKHVINLINLIKNGVIFNFYLGLPHI